MKLRHPAALSRAFAKIMAPNREGSNRPLRARALCIEHILNQIPNPLNLHPTPLPSPERKFEIESKNGAGASLEQLDLTEAFAETLREPPIFANRNNVQGGPFYHPNASQRRIEALSLPRGPSSRSDWRVSLPPPAGMLNELMPETRTEASNHSTAAPVQNGKRSFTLAFIVHGTPESEPKRPKLITPDAVILGETDLHDCCNFINNSFGGA